MCAAGYAKKGGDFTEVVDVEIVKPIDNKDNISVGCVQPACKLYVFRWLLLHVSTGGRGVSSSEQV